MRLLPRLSCLLSYNQFKVSEFGNYSFDNNGWTKMDIGLFIELKELYKNGCKNIKYLDSFIGMEETV